MKITDYIKAIDAELQWCFANPDKNLSKEYQKGFTNGLIQAKYLITKAGGKREALAALDDEVQE